MTPSGETKRLNAFERYLSAWVALCIVAGVVLGTAAPGLVGVLSRLEVRHVNLPIAILIWLMIYPMMLRIDFAAIRGVGRRPRGHPGGPVRELAGEAVQHGGARLVLLQAPVRGTDRAGARRPVPGGRHHPGRGALHGHGVRLELSDRWRSRVHARPGGAERSHHAGRVRADRDPAARSVEHHRALRRPVLLGGPLHRDPAGGGDPVPHGPPAHPGPGVVRRRLPARG